METIKNCPLCEGIGDIESCVKNDVYYYRVKCSECGLRTTGIEVTEKRTGLEAVHEAVALWNMRTGEPKKQEQEEEDNVIIKPDYSRCYEPQRHHTKVNVRRYKLYE